MPVLQDLCITKVWNSRDRDPIIYLGFPLLQSLLQRQTFVNNFLGSLQRLVDSHSRRNLSVLGRATVANSLLLSTCWYAMRVIPLPLSTIASIKSIVFKFITRNIFPKVSWKIITTPKSCGGLGILDPTTQQLALFYRWVDGLLFDRPSKTLIQQFLSIHISNCFGSNNVLMCLLYPKARRSLSGSSVSISTLACRVVDVIPRKSYTYIPATLDVLLLPLCAIVSSTTDG